MTKSAAQTLADELRAIRRAAGLTQAQLAQKTQKGKTKGFSSSLVAQTEGGKNLSADALTQWLDACKASDQFDRLNALRLEVKGPRRQLLEERVTTLEDSLADIRRILQEIGKRKGR